MESALALEVTYQGLGRVYVSVCSGTHLGPVHTCRQYSRGAGLRWEVLLAGLRVIWL